MFEKKSYYLKMKLKRILRNKLFLQKLRKCHNKKRLIINSTQDELDSICECILNILKGNLKIKVSDKHKLEPYINDLRQLSTIQPPKTQLRILQTGGFLQTLIPIIAAGISLLLQ